MSPGSSRQSDMTSPRSTQGGASLVVSLLMLVAVLLLGISAAQIAMQGDKASRGDRDRQIAFQAAEAALLDAELDIEKSPSAATTRSAIFDKSSTEGFPVSGCVSGNANKYLGLCKSTPGATPVWETVDFTDTTTSAATVPYGKFTGQTFQTGKGSLPTKLPRYIIELMAFNQQGDSADGSGLTYFYRVTAIGFGTRDSTQVVLQSFYRKGA